MAKKKEEVIEDVALVTQESAQAFFDDLKSKQIILVPKDLSIAWVCEDGNIFFDYNPARVWVEEVKFRQSGKSPLLFEVKPE